MRSLPLLRNGEPLAGWQVWLATSWWQRAVGLLGTSRLPERTGLWIEPCASVHTIGMRYAIDVVFVDAAQRIVKLSPGKRPFGAAACRQAKAVLELGDGGIAVLALRVGERLAPDRLAAV